MKLKITLIALLAICLYSCDDNTGTIGISSEIDQVSNSTSNYPVYTKSVLMNQGIIANNNNCYLGSMDDPETGMSVLADFAAQFQTFESNCFPDKELMVDARDTNNVKSGVPTCDSCEVRLFFKSYYGDGKNPMKIQVYEMSNDPDKIMREETTYYTDIDLSQYLPENAQPLASRMFTAVDYQVDEEDREDEDYNMNLVISLPASLGQRIMDSYYEHPEYFKDNYTFIRNVLPGLYFTCQDGSGTMLKVYVGTINVFFSCKESVNETDYYPAISRFAATPEVIQSSRLTNTGNLESLIEGNVDYTYLKTPAGIATEVTLPISEVFSGEHAIDSVSKASLTFTRYNRDQEKTQFDIPSTLLMVRKSHVADFFANSEVANNRTSYTASFSSTYNTYTFDNISRMLSYCQHEKVSAIVKRLEEKGLSKYTDAQFKAEEQLWENDNPDWNKVLLIPVSVTTITQTTSSGTYSVMTAVNHDTGLNSVKLIGGNTPIQLQIVYSHFNQ